MIKSALPLITNPIKARGEEGLILLSSLEVSVRSKVHNSFTYQHFLLFLENKSTEFIGVDQVVRNLDISIWETSKNSIYCSC